MTRSRSSSVAVEVGGMQHIAGGPSAIAPAASRDMHPINATWVAKNVPSKTCAEQERQITHPHPPRIYLLIKYLDQEFLAFPNWPSTTAMRSRIHRPLAALDLFLTRPSSSQAVRAPIRHQPPCLLRQFATTPIACAGHNKWSKTKHIKAVTDKKKMNERVAFTKTITLYSRCPSFALLPRSS